MPLGTVWMLTPVTPVRAISNIASSTHRAEAKVSLTPRVPPHEIPFISSTRSGSWCAVAMATYGATEAARPREDCSERSCGMVTTLDLVQCLSG